MKNTNPLFIATVLLLTGLVHAQIGIGTVTPDISSELDVSSTVKGFLPPRMPDYQMVSIQSPALGLLVYCTNCSPLGLYINQASGAAQWQHISGNYPIITTDATGNLVTSLQYFYNGWTDPNLTGTKTYSGTSTTISHSVGEAFSENTSCTGKLISRSYLPNSCPTSVTGESGTIYPTVYINGQCWMKTNLREIPSNYATINETTPWTTTDPTTIIADKGYWGFYNNSVGASNFASQPPANDYGYLYQWSAAMNIIPVNFTSFPERLQGACPQGWHVPSDCEFMYLEHGIGMSIAYQNSSLTTSPPRDDAAIDQGNTSLKIRGNVGAISGNNATGYTLLGAGNRSSAGVFGAINTDMFLWTSTRPGTYNVRPYARLTNTGKRNIQRSSNSYSPAFAFSVRCLKD